MSPAIRSTSAGKWGKTWKRGNRSGLPIASDLQMVFGFLIASVVKAVGRRVAGFMKTTVYVPTVVSAVIVSVAFSVPSASTS